MFPDSFLPNLVLFLVAQVTAWIYMRTGLVRRGVVLMISVWIMADAALLARFAYQQTGFWFVMPLVLMQVHALVETVLLLSGQLRRRWTAGRRSELFRKAFAHYLRDELDEAAAILRTLRRNDPWDLQATLELATVLANQGRYRRAVGLFRVARSLDRRHQYRDFISDQLRRFGARQRRRTDPPGPAPETAATESGPAQASQL